jgi:hypothetical protein
MIREAMQSSLVLFVTSSVVILGVLVGLSTRVFADEEIRHVVVVQSLSFSFPSPAMSLSSSLVHLVYWGWVGGWYNSASSCWSVMES